MTSIRGTFFRKCTPSVPRRWLMLVAGAVWAGVGIMLLTVACRRLWAMESDWKVFGAAVGIGSGIAIYRFGLSRLARRNKDRIAALPERVCLFAFQAWRSYFLIFVMMGFGHILRHSSLPPMILAVLYMAMGTGLLLSGTLYYK